MKGSIGRIVEVVIAAAIILALTVATLKYLGIDLQG